MSRKYNNVSQVKTATTTNNFSKFGVGLDTILATMNEGVLDQLTDVLLIAVSAGSVFLTVFYVLKKFFEHEAKKREFELRKESLKNMMPLRLQAYERLILFCERTDFSAMIMRIHKTGMSARLLRSEMLSTIRTEYDHNLTQQLYVSSTAWELVKNAKEQSIKIINLASTKITDDATGVDFTKSLLDLVGQAEKTPQQVAIDTIKSEARKLF